MKKAFTLIELMVVIVIISILASMAAPKLFGISAKAKVSELYPTASSYAKLQAAFLVEMASLGAWASIGYAPPGPTGPSSGATIYFSYDEPTVGQWSATLTKPVGDCLVTDRIWTMVSNPTTGASVAGGQALTVAGCSSLSTSFSQIGK